MVVGEDVAVGRDDDARAEALRLAIACSRSATEQEASSTDRSRWRYVCVDEMLTDAWMARSATAVKSGSAPFIAAAAPRDCPIGGGAGEALPGCVSDNRPETTSPNMNPNATRIVAVASSFFMRRSFRSCWSSLPIQHSIAIQSAHRNCRSPTSARRSVSTPSKVGCDGVGRDRRAKRNAREKWPWPRSSWW